MCYSIITSKEELCGVGGVMVALLGCDPEGVSSSLILHPKTFLKKIKKVLDFS